MQFARKRKGLIRRLRQREHGVKKIAIRLRRLNNDEAEAKIRSFNMRRRMLRMQRRDLRAAVAKTRQKTKAEQERIVQILDAYEGALASHAKGKIPRLCMHNFFAVYKRFKPMLQKGENILKGLSDSLQLLDHFLTAAGETKN
jgi:ferritin-like metal-binding protein YciE